MKPLAHVLTTATKRLHFEGHETLNAANYHQNNATMRPWVLRCWKPKVTFDVSAYIGDATWLKNHQPNKRNSQLRVPSTTKTNGSSEKHAWSINTFILSQFKYKTIIQRAHSVQSCALFSQTRLRGAHGRALVACTQLTSCKPQTEQHKKHSHQWT